MLNMNELALTCLILFIMGALWVIFNTLLQYFVLKKETLGIFLVAILIGYMWPGIAFMSVSTVFTKGADTISVLFMSFALGYAFAMVAVQKINLDKTVEVPRDRRS